MPRPTKYQVIERDIRRQIVSGSLDAGDQLPSEADLCGAYNLSRGCVRRALQQLKKEGIVDSRRGMGYFVLDSTATWQDTCLAMELQLDASAQNQPATLFYTLLEQEITSRNRRLVHVAPDAYPDLLHLFEDLANRQLRRVILGYVCGHHHSSCRRLAAILRNFPARVVMSVFEEARVMPPCDTVYTDWIGGTREAVHELSRRFGDDIAYAGLNGNSWSDARLAGFLAAMQELGHWSIGDAEPVINCLPDATPEALHSPTSACFAAAADHLAETLRKAPVKGLLCCNDMLIKLLMERLPADDLPVLVGYDNSLWAVRNQITSVGINVRRHIEVVLKTMMEPAEPVVKMIPVSVQLYCRGALLPPDEESAG